MNDVVRKRSEKGQTIILVAVSLVSLLAMAALAIDVVSLYVARSEIQRAADAAALAGAKAIADSGITTLNGVDLSTTYYPAIQTLAQSMATSAINATLPLNPVAGSAPSLASGSPVFNPLLATATTPANSWQVTVTLQQTSLPTFFARIFGRNAASTQVSATAEAYNPGNIPAATSYAPIAPRCVKPWLVANRDPTHPGAKFVDPTTFQVEFGVLALGGNPSFDLTPDCPSPALCGAGQTDPTPKYLTGTNRVEYVAAAVTANTGNVTPSACSSASDFEQSIYSCDENVYGLNCGGGTAFSQWDSSVDPTGSSGLSATGAECLIHATAAGTSKGQDFLDNTGWPFSPNKITAGSGALSGSPVSTSSSIVTIPIIDTDNWNAPPNYQETILGYLQAFINRVEDGSGGTTPGDINITILNVVGCNSNPSGAQAVAGGGGTSAIPVRLISP